MSEEYAAGGNPTGFPYYGNDDGYDLLDCSPPVPQYVRSHERVEGLPRSNTFPMAAHPSETKHRYTCGATSQDASFGFDDSIDCNASDVGDLASEHDEYRVPGHDKYREAADNRADIPIDSPFAQEARGYHVAKNAADDARDRWSAFHNSQKGETYDDHRAVSYAHTAAMRLRKEIDEREKYQESYIGYDKNVRGHARRIKFLKEEEVIMLDLKSKHQQDDAPAKRRKQHRQYDSHAKRRKYGNS